MPRAVLLAIGNELLNGEVRDRNLYTLITTLTRSGVTVEAAALVRDDLPRIAASLLWMLESSPDVMILCGGLGPTADDGTLAAVAHALQRPLQENAAARALVETHYQRLMEAGYLQALSPEAPRRKMATLPEGAEPLPNPRGTAPGVRLLYGQTLIYCLPGVPEEMEGMLHESVLPDLRARYELHPEVRAETVIHVDDEASLAALLRETQERFPDVYLKSLARAFPAARVEGIRIIATGPDSERVAAALQAVAARAQTLLTP